MAGWSKALKQEGLALLHNAQQSRICETAKDTRQQDPGTWPGRVSLQEPPGCQVVALQEGQLLQVCIQPIGITGLFFFMLLWNAFMVFWAVISISNHVWVALAFGTLHYCVGIFLLFTVVGQLFMRETLEVGPQMWAHRKVLWGRTWGKGAYGFTQDLTGASSEIQISHGNKGGIIKTPVLVLKSAKCNHQVGSGRPAADLDWLAGIINLHLEQVREVEAGTDASHAEQEPGAGTSCVNDHGDIGLVRTDDKLCVVCLNAPAAIWLAPCGHRPMCAACTHQLRAGTTDAACPICRTKVESTMVGIFP